MSSPVFTPVPPKTGVGALPIEKNIKTVSIGAAMKAMRGKCSSTAEMQISSSEIWVSRARNWPRAVTNMLRTPSFRSAVSKSSGSLNADVTVLGMSVLNSRPDAIECSAGRIRE